MPTGMKRDDSDEVSQGKSFAQGTRGIVSLRI